MNPLPIRRMTLYKHGVGYFERRGKVGGTSVRLSFPRAAMDDVLKSLVVLDVGGGQVRGIDFETPEDRLTLMNKGSIHLSDTRSLLDLLRDLRGRTVRCSVWGEDESIATVGTVIGVDYEPDSPAGKAMVSIYQPETRTIRAIPLSNLAHVQITDETAASDLVYFLRASQSEEDKRAATLHLSEGDHDLLVGYIGPAPAWRVSYRMLVEQNTETGNNELLLQGWGLFDNQLDEDLDDVQITLVAGMPVSFRYRLYEPKTPVRPLVEDEERTVSAPIFYEGAPPAAPMAAMEAVGSPMPQRTMYMSKARMAMDADSFAGLASEHMQTTVAPAATGEERGALFAYEVAYPVSVARGQSAMVPILSQRLPCKRDLLYNRAKLPLHPIASVRLNNETGLTLERGPVTVLEENQYAGEAVVPFTATGGELIVPFAVELGIKIEEQSGAERRIASVNVRDDYLLVQEYDIRIMSYNITNTLSQAAEVVIEHPLNSGYSLFGMEKPLETGTSFARWSIACPANQRTLFSVSERQLISRREQVRSLNGKQIQFLLREDILDEKTAQALDRILDLYRQSDEAQQNLKRLGSERETIYRQQQQIQGNLTPLGRDGREGELRTRYVTELGKLEDKLAQLGVSEQQVKDQIASLEQQARELLSKLAAPQQESAG